jgi:cytochrome c peroxidase
MKKKILLSLTAVIATGGLVSDLDYFDRKAAPVLRVDSPTHRYSTAVPALGAIREARWEYYHMPATQLSFYAAFPVANSLISRDITAGLRHFELTPVLDRPQSGNPVPEDKLAPIEIVVPQGPMLPQPNTDLRWHAWLDQTAMQDVGDIAEALGTLTSDGQHKQLANPQAASR